MVVAAAALALAQVDNAIANVRPFLSSDALMQQAIDEGLDFVPCVPQLRYMWNLTVN